MTTNQTPALTPAMPARAAAYARARHAALDVLSRGRIVGYVIEDAPSVSFTVRVNGATIAVTVTPAGLDVTNSDAPEPEYDFIGTNVASLVSIIAEYADAGIDGLTY